jgi:hypothetical protein
VPISRRAARKKTPRGFWINNHTPEPTLVDSRQARAVVGALSMLIRMVGAYTSVGIILQQARSEIVSLVRSEEESQTRAAA